MGFVANHVPDAFRSLRNSAIVGESGAGFTIDNILRLNFPDLSDHSVAATICIKRKWGSVYCSIDVQTRLPVSNPPGSSNSKTSSATGCTTSSAKTTDEESSMDLELNFSLHLGSEKTPSSKKEATI
ncbi:hypothetical protein R6Q59_032022 [Mikania micrantha]